MSSENVERLRAVYAEWAKGNLRAGGDLFSPDVVIEPMSDGRQQFFGPQGVESYVRDFVAQWDDFRIEAREFHDLGDTIVVTEGQSGTGKSSGVKTEMTFYCLWVFRDGLAVRVRWESERSKAFAAAAPPG